MEQVRGTRTQGEWVRPWNMEKPDDIFNRDERFFSLVVRGFLGWMTRNIVMYNKSIKHFILNTGNSYMYIENNGYEYSMNETSGEDWMYHESPRCIVTMESVSIPTEELTSPYASGTYERRDGNDIKGFHAHMRRIPIQMQMNLNYYFNTMNEGLVLIQEIIDKMSFQQYFSINYLGNVLDCSIEFPLDFNIQINQIDLTNTDPNTKSMQLSVNINTNYPKIQQDTEILTEQVIRTFEHNSDQHRTGDIYNLNKNGVGTVIDVSTRIVGDPEIEEE